MTEFMLPPGFTVTGHTGCLDENGEETRDNSLASIEAAVRTGADIVEVDLHFLADGTPVLSHDRVPAEKEKDCVRLDEALALLATYPSLRMNIDLKSFWNLPEIRRLADRHGVRDRLFFTGVGACRARGVARAETGIPYYINCRIPPKSANKPACNERLLRHCKRLGGIGINFEKSGASPLLTNMCRERGLLVSVWTVTKEADIRRVAATAPDNITSRDPALVIKTLRR